MSSLPGLSFELPISDLTRLLPVESLFVADVEVRVALLTALGGLGRNELGSSVLVTVFIKQKSG